MLIKKASKKLNIELVPQSSWYSNVRSQVSKSKWDKIRKKCYKEAGYKCEICGCQGPKWPVECHEIWDYNDKQNIQKLEGFIALCPSCHKVKHFGYARVSGNEDKAYKQLCTVNNISMEEAADIVFNAFEKWEERSRKQWEVNTDYIEEYLQ